MNLSVEHKDIDILSESVKSFIYNKTDADFLQIRNDFSKINEQIELKSNFSQSKRDVLVAEMEKQYSFLSQTEKSRSAAWENIQLLKQNNTYTLTTGQQIHIFLGPMYVPHKIMSAVASCQKLKKENPTFDFVPIFWMATEDHDFEEIRSLKLWNKEFVWEESEGGATGELSCKNILPIFEQIKSNFNLKTEENAILDIFELYYSNSKTLSEATIKIVNHFFGQYGVIAFDANRKSLKELFKPYIAKEIKEGFAYKSVKSFSEIVKDNGFELQIGARDTALFLFENKIRERIDRLDDSTFKLSPSNKIYSKNELLNLLETNPELFSPNVALRPLYEEVILPNLAYFGGAGEIAYWFQLKNIFEENNVPFPILMLRKMAVYINGKSIADWKELGFNEEELLLSQNAFQKTKTEKIANNSLYIELESELEALTKKISDVSFSIDSKSIKHIKLITKEWKKSLKAHFDSLEQKILEQNASKIKKVEKIKNFIYPEGMLQERVLSFLEHSLNSLNSLKTEVDYEDNRSIEIRTKS